MVFGLADVLVILVPNGSRRVLGTYSVAIDLARACATADADRADDTRCRLGAELVAKGSQSCIAVHTTRLAAIAEVRSALDTFRGATEG
jgi:hypothetical protein